MASASQVGQASTACPTCGSSDLLLLRLNVDSGIDCLKYDLRQGAGERARVREDPISCIGRKRLVVQMGPGVPHTRSPAETGALAINRLQWVEIHTNTAETRFLCGAAIHYFCWKTSF
jgi:hypothetical protein